MSHKIGIHCFVTGIVQGVFFRDFTCKQAQALGLTGWVKNIKDGRVELMAFGEESALEQFLLLIKQGPPASKVTHFVCNKIPYEILKGFEVRY